MLRVTRFAAIATFAAISCETPTEPHLHNEPVLLLAYCSPAGTAISCSAFISNAPGLASHADVTLAAVWTSEPPDAVTLLGPGRFAAVVDGEVELRAQYLNWRSSSPNPRFLVAPDVPPRRLGSVFVLVREVDAAPNGAPIAGAVVTLAAGYRAGTNCTTNVGGTCILNPVTIHETYTLSVMKDGYRTTSVEVRGDLGVSTPVQVSLPRQ